MVKTGRQDKWLLPAALAGLALTNGFMVVAAGLLLGLLFLSCDSRSRPRLIGVAALAVALAVGALTLKPLLLVFTVAASLAGLLILRNNLFSSVTSGALVACLIGALATLAFYLAGPVGLDNWHELQNQTFAMQRQWGKLAAGSDPESRLALERTAAIVVALLPGQYVLMMVASFFIAVLVFRRWGVSGYPLSLGCTHFNQYRFEDHWIWLVILGLGLILLDSTGLAHHVAVNLLFVMAVLYVIRGLAVIFFFIALKNGGLFIRVLAVSLCLTPMCLLHLAFGVFDTWADFRKTVPASR